MHTYRESHDGNGGRFYTVGFWSADGAWYPLTDFDKEREAMERVNYLNGGNSHVTTYSLEP